MKQKKHTIKLINTKHNVHHNQALVMRTVTILKKIKLKMHNVFLNLKGVIIIRKRRKKRIIDHQVIKKFEKV